MRGGACMYMMRMKGEVYFAFCFCSVVLDLRSKTAER